LKKENLTQILLITVGIILSVIGIDGFLVPAQLLSNGFAGIAILVEYLFHINKGLFILLVNIPLFLYSIKYVDKYFFVSSLISMLLYSWGIGCADWIANYIVLDDILLQAIFGGIFVGVGLGCMFKANSSFGGMDIVTVILKIKFGIPIGTTFLIINTLIVCAVGVILGIKPAMYTIISMYVTSIMLESTKNMFNKQKAIILISDKYQEVADFIMTNLGRGVTFLEAEGAYTNNKKKMIYCIVSSSQVVKVKELVYEIDKEAFISINNVDEVRGRGFKASAF
jgi:uncharacterized membrane-anchored protein YitT (DUF2179 family)